ncbi:MAG: hypothetical protein LBU24_02880 [Methanocalculaceae archaeon]|jgi:hypothetical protein|nr:hypothetical protein [Methanocalculaceae archaeon]
MKLERGIALLFATAFVFLLVLAGTATEIDTNMIGIPDRTLNSSNLYSYLTINSVYANVSGVDAEFTVNYSIDPCVEVLVFLFGKQDLKNRLLKVINYPESNCRSQVVKFTDVNVTRASFFVMSVGVDQIDGTYWYPRHEFATMIPNLTFHTKKFDQIYNSTRVIERGFGYY